MLPYIDIIILHLRNKKLPYTINNYNNTNLLLQLKEPPKYVIKDTIEVAPLKPIKRIDKLHELRNSLHTKHLNIEPILINSKLENNELSECQLYYEFLYESNISRIRFPNEELKSIIEIILYPDLEKIRQRIKKEKGSMLDIIG